MSLRRNPNHGNPVGVSGRVKNQNLTKRVADIILTTDHPAYNSSDDIGVIFFTDVKLNEDYIDSTSLPSAKPLSRNNFTYPSIGELVQIIETTSNDIYNDLGGNLNNKTLYYTPAINIHNNTTSNSLPHERLTKKVTPKKTSNIKSFSFKKEFSSSDREIARNQLDNYLRNLGYTSGVTDPRAPKYLLSQTSNGDYIFRLKDSEDNEEIAIKLGTYFKENPSQKPLIPTEGDSIYEGKSGQRIHMTTTGPNGINPISIDVTDSPDDGNPNIGDPAILLTLGKGEKENITADDSSIYVLSNQKVNIDATSTNIDSLKSEYTPVSSPLEEIAKTPVIEIPNTVPEDELTIKPTVFDFTTVVDDNPTLVNTGSLPNIEDDPVFAALDEAQEEGLLDFDDENFEVSGTELSDEEKEEDNNNSNNQNEEDSGQTEGEEYTPRENPEDPIVFKNLSQYKKWEKEGNGKADYPLKFIFNKTYGQVEGIVDPKPVSELIAQLEADGVNATNLPNIKHLVCHITATTYTNQHELMKLFAFTKGNNGWDRHGYNISVDDEGGCNYNVDLIKTGYSYGAGGSLYEKNQINGFGPLLNNNSINISWIGNVDLPLFREDLGKGNTRYTGGTRGTTTGPNITANQIYAYEKLIKYFVRAFPDILIVGHNQITISGGYGKSCPSWNNVRFCELIGIPNRNIYKTHIDELPNPADVWDIVKDRQSNKTKTYIEAEAQNNNGRYFANFNNYHGQKYNRTAEYIYYLTRPNEADRFIT